LTLITLYFQKVFEIHRRLIMPTKKSNPSSKKQQTSDPNVEIITPIKVRRHTGQPDSSRPPRFSVIPLLLLFVGLGVMAAGGFIVIRHLYKHPVNVDEKTPGTDTLDVPIQKKAVPDANRKAKLPVEASIPPAPVTVNPQQAMEPQSIIPAAKQALEKETAEKAMKAFLTLEKGVREKGGAEWGGSKYEEMTTLSREADDMFKDQKFLAAAEKYAQAGRKAGELADSSQAVFQRLIEEGLKALEAGDSNVAQKKFRTALMIEPFNDSAQQNLERAQNLEAVNRLIESGKTHENNGRFAFAHTDYREALKLVPESKAAQKALNRVKERITDQQFQKFMSDGLAAYHDGRYQSARTRLLKAKSFRPDSREVQNALLQVDEAIRLAKIEELRQKALTARQAEDWENALRAYLAVLKIDPNISFALQGKERALKHIRVTKRIRFFLEKPDAMASNPQLQNAVLLIEEAESLQPKGPRLSQRLDELKAMVDAARTPVTVTIESDNLTEVAVYKVGKLGRFTTRELSLRPGSYTVVGSRDGYKDVRQKIIVKPYQKELRIMLICTNKV
jgi:tetratricopeptide (TPR) repeat protein